MTDDLIELLLESELSMDNGAWATCREAAVEILRLRAENEKLQWELGKALDTLVVHDAVCAENEKLRAALAEIGYDFSTNRDEAAIVARKVLR